MIDVYRFPPVCVTGQEWTEIAPVQVSRSAVTGAEYVSAAMRKRRIVRLQISALGGDNSGAGQMEVLKRLLDGGVNAVRLYSHPINWHKDAPLYLYSQGLTATVTGSVALVAGLPASRQVARAGDYVSFVIGGETYRAQVASPAMSDGSGVAQVDLVDELPFGNGVPAILGASDTGVFRPVSMPGSMQPVNNNWSYAWDFREVFSDEVGGFREVDPWLPLPTISPMADYITPEDEISMSSDVGTVYYTLNGSVPTNQSTEFEQNFTLDPGAHKVRWSAYDNGVYGRIRNHRYTVVPNLVDAIANGELGTFTRASGTTYWDADGVLQTAGNDVWPLTYRYDPVSELWVPAGRQVWGSRTNSLHRNVELDNASSWNQLGLTSVAGIDTDGKFPAAFRLTGGDSGSQAIDSTVSPTSYWFAQAYFRAGTHHIAAIGGSSTLQRYSTFDLSTGTVLRIGAGHEGAGMIPVGDDWWLCWAYRGDASNTNSVSPGDAFGFGDANGVIVGDAADGLTLDIALPNAVDNVDVRSPFPPIITPSAASATRLADTATITDLESIHWNPAAWTLLADVTIPAAGSDSRSIATVYRTDGNSISLRRQSSTIRLLFLGGSGTIIGSSVTPDDRVRIAATCNGSQAKLLVSGGEIQSDEVALPTALESLRIGHRNGDFHWNQNIRSVYLLPRAMSDDEMTTWVNAL